LCDLGIGYPELSSVSLLELASVRGRLKYLTSISFEDRCLALLRDLPSNTADGQALILDFEGYANVSPYIFNKREALSILEQKGCLVNIILC
jgi:Protein of unknown function (DUF2958)